MKFLVETQLDRGRVKDAEATLALSRRHFPADGALRSHLPLVLYAQGRLDDAERDLDSLGSGYDAALRSKIIDARADFARLRGRYAEATRLAHEASAAMAIQGVSGTALTDSLDWLALDAWFHGASDRIVRAVDATLAAFPLRQLAIADRPYFRAATVYALAGRPDKGRAILEQYQREVTDTARLRLQGPGLHNALAEIALADHKPLVALAEFRRGDVASDGFPAGECEPCAVFSFARAFDLAEMPDSAIATYERYLASPYWAKVMELDNFALAGTHKRLGELYEARNDRQKAISHYMRFVELWKNADPEFQPKVAEVKQRVARLTDAERR